jgi:thiol-disulfide isomerase/thioredoxin
MKALLVLLAAAAAPSAQTPLDALLGAGQVTTLDGKTLTRDDLRGRIVLVDVWATWCAPCLAEMPTLKRLQADHGDALLIVGVNLDSVPRRDLRQWLARKDITWPQLFDGRGVNGPLANQLNVEFLPRSFLYDEEGHLVATDLRGNALVRAVRVLAGGYTE